MSRNQTIIVIDKSNIYKVFRRISTILRKRIRHFRFGLYFAGQNEVKNAHRYIILAKFY